MKAVRIFAACAVLFALCAPAQARSVKGAGLEAGGYQPAFPWPVDAQGWSVFATPSAGTNGNSCNVGAVTQPLNSSCIWYYSPTGYGTGNQCVQVATVSNPAIDDNRPDSGACLLTQANIDRIRDGSADVIALKRGVDFRKNFFIEIKANGYDDTQRLRITSYGSTTLSRPRLIEVPNAIINACFYVPNGKGTFLIIDSIECYGSFNDPASADYTAPIATSAASSGATVTFASLPATVVLGLSAYNLTNPAASGSGRRIASVSGNTITLNGNMTVASGDRIGFISEGDAIQFVGNGVTSPHLEDMKISYYMFSIDFQNAICTPLKWTLYRNQFTDSYSLGGQHSSNIFFGDTACPGTVSQTAYVAENLIDHGGWAQINNACTPGRQNSATCYAGSKAISPTLDGAGAFNQNHNEYYHELSPQVIRVRNISTNAGGSCTQFRSGGVSYNNFNARCGVLVSNPGVTYPATVAYDVFQEVYEGYQAIAQTNASSTASNVLNFAQTPTGFGMAVGLVIDNPGCSGCSVPANTAVVSWTNTTVNLSGNVTVASGDVITFSDGTGGHSLNMVGGAGYRSKVSGPHNVFIQDAAVDGFGLDSAAGVGPAFDNWFYNIRQGLLDENGCKSTAYTNNKQFGETVASTACAGVGTFTAVGTPTIQAYDTSIGGPGTMAHFIAGARANRKGAWDVRYTANAANNFIRAATSASIPLQ